MKKKCIFLFILSCFLSFITPGKNFYGQEVPRIVLNVKVTDTEGKVVSSAAISSDRSRTVVFTNDEGMFSLEVQPNEVILIEAEGYEPLIIKALDLTEVKSVFLLTQPFHLKKSDEINMPFNTMKKRQIISAINTLKPEEIDKLDSKQGITEAIRGRVPGVYGSQNIRGLSNPLIVIDGFPRASSSKGSDFNMISYLDMHEIKEITVLKDASSRMLYGAQANDGVILITTRRGQAFKSKVGIRAETGIKTPVSYPDYLNAADYMTMYNLASVNDGGTARYSDEVIENTRNGEDRLRYPDEDFFNEIYLNNFSNFFRLSADASGGNEQARYYSKLGWTQTGDIYALQQEGKSFLNNEMTFRGNVDYDVSSWLKSGLDAFFLFGADRQPIRNFWSDAASHLPNSFPMTIPLSALGDTLIGETARVFDGSILGGTNQYQNNIYGNFVQGGFRTYTSRISQISTNFDFDLGMITEGLTARAAFTYDILNSYILSYSHQYAIYEPRYVTKVDSPPNDSLTVNKIGEDRRSQTQNLSNPLSENRFGVISSVNYNRTFSEKHTVSAVANGYWGKYDIMESNYSSKYNNFGLTANYMFDNRIIAQITGTLTGSMYLPEDSRYRAAPSIGLGWVVSEEGFLSGNNFVNYLKVKAVYGKILTDEGFPTYRIYNSTFSGSGTFRYNQNLNQNSGRVFRNLANTEIDLISRNDINVGLEAMLGDNRLWVEGNYFRTLKDGVITRRSDAYPAIIPVLQYENYEQYSDQGVDLAINYKDKAGDFRYSLSANMVYVIPKAVLLEEPVYSDAPYRQLQGKPYDAIFGYVAEGLFQDEDEIAAHPSQASLGGVIPGDIKYKDLNDDGIIDANDQKIIGYSRARLGYGAHLSLGYKNFSLFALGTGQSGSNRTFSNSYYWQVGQTAKYSDVVLNSWTPATASTATYPILHLNAADNNHRTSTYWLENNDWFTLHTLQLTYDIVPGFGKGFQVYLRGSNLLTISPVKEKLELNIGSAPQMRTYALGANVMF